MNKKKKKTARNNRAERIFEHDNVAFELIYLLLIYKKVAFFSMYVEYIVDVFRLYTYAFEWMCNSVGR